MSDKRDLKSIKKPSTALIKLVEATGILLGFKKCSYKDKSGLFKLKTFLIVLY
jgi:hypothetical protein